MERFVRTRLLLGPEAFARLEGSHVAVIGLGAVGGYAVEGLARAGVGSLTLVDFDVIQPANINRQVIALDSTLGQPKAQAACRRVLDINPACRAAGLELFVDEETVRQIIDRRPDVVIDAVDSLNPKVQILSAARQADLATFSSMGAALRTDPSRVTIGDISQTSGCPLARRLRKRLRTLGVRSGITCVYSTEPVCFDYQPPEPAEPGTPGAERGRPRRTLGSLPTLTGIFGLTLANAVIHHLCAEKS